MNQPKDWRVRDLATEPGKSFIVQAPAGSGKTSLLTLRLLKLLTVVNKPEECLSLTFTKKAAFEMRQRVLDALRESNNTPSNDYQQQVYAYATKVLQRSQQLNWQLIENPNRLKIMTIDAFAASIVTRMPILSKFAQQLDIADNPKKLYRQAVVQLLKELQPDDYGYTELQNVYRYLDNQREIIIALLQDLLPKREQWLRYILQDNLREHLEHSLQTVISAQLAQLVAILPESFTEFVALVASVNSKVENIPEADYSQIENWQILADYLLTSDNQIRKSVTAKQGFLPPNSAENLEEKHQRKQLKQAMQQLLQEYADNKPLIAQFAAIRLLPDSHYDENSWQMLQALTTILPLLAARLKLVFKENHKVDFTEVLLASIVGLGDCDGPSDLALYLDYQIKHILVDEFQDTSIAQFQLLEQLTYGWQPDEARSLFLVGDPMQSIYRFRQAEVGLFLKARLYGINQIKLNYLQLEVNFRSTSGVVNWVNRVFSSCFPKHSDISLGAINYVESKSHNSLDGECQVHGLTTNEAQYVVELIKKLHHPDKTLAVLVRARSHLHRLLPTIQQAGIAYTGVELESLFQQSVIQDLLALTRAILHFADEIAWLTILRAPWCGLSLSDLTILQGSNNVVTALLEIDKINLSADGRLRLTKILQVIKHAIARRDRDNLSKLIYKTWCALGAEHIYPQNYQAVDRFFKLLSVYKYSYQELEQACANEYINKISEDKNPVEIMTIHKAKGLEFDTVIVAGMGRRTSYDSEQILLWDERTSDTENYLLLAPIKPATSLQSKTYNYLKVTNQQRALYETMRLLYVAATRAKSNLHLVGTLQNEKPPLGSLFAVLWNYTDKKIIKLSSQQDYVETRNLARVPIDYNFPQFDSPCLSTTRVNHSEYWLPLVGTAVHKIFSHLGSGNECAFPRNFLPLRQIPVEFHTQAISWFDKAITVACSSPIGKWILNHQHRDSYTEWPISLIEGKQLKHYVVDRSFISDNIRWIVDYKLSNELNPEQYRAQLMKYKQIVKRLMPEPMIKTALYYPLQGEFIEL